MFVLLFRKLSSLDCYAMASPPLTERSLTNTSTSASTYISSLRSSSFMGSSRFTATSGSEKQPSSRAHSLPSADEPTRPLKFFVVDDNSINRVLLKRMLDTLFKCETVCYASAKETLEDLKNSMSACAGSDVNSSARGPQSYRSLGSGGKQGSSTAMSGAWSGRCPTHNVVLTDIHMPEMTGLDLTRELRQCWNATTLPIIGV